MPDSEFKTARESFRRGELAEAVEICARGIQSAQLRGDAPQLWELRTLLSRCLCAQGHHPEALSLLEPPPLKEEVGPEIRARVLNQRGFAFSQTGNLAATRAAVDEALELASAAGLELLVAEIEMTRCTLFFYLGRYDAVESCARVALKIAQEQHSVFIEACGAAGMGKAAMYRGQHAEAIRWFERAIILFESEGASFYASSMGGEVGCCHFVLHEDDKAQQYFSAALEASERAGALPRYHIDLANMGCLHLRRGECAAAISHFQRALDIARELGDLISTSKWLWNLARAYSYMGNPALSHSFQKQSDDVSRQVDKARAAASS
jgi:tetratricopeptide (TPR) repeat protein